MSASAKASKRLRSAAEATEKKKPRTSKNVISTAEESESNGTAIHGTSATVVEEEFIEVEKRSLRQHEGYRTSQLLRCFLENDPEEEELTLTVPRRMVLFSLSNDEDFFQFADVFKYWSFRMPTEEWLDYLFEHLQRLKKEKHQQLIDRFEGLVFYWDEDAVGDHSDGNNSAHINKRREMDMLQVIGENDQAMEHMASTGLLHLLKLMVEKGRFTAFPALLATALIRGFVEMFDYLIKLHIEPPVNLPELLMAVDRFDLLQMLWDDAGKYRQLSGNIICMKKFIRQAAVANEEISKHNLLKHCVNSKDNSACCTFMINNNIFRFKQLAETAMGACKFEFLRFLYIAVESGRITPTQNIFSTFEAPMEVKILAQHGDFETIKFMYDRQLFNFFSLDWDIVKTLIKEGQLSCLQRMFDAGIGDETEELREDALNHGQIEVFKYLYERWKQRVGAAEARRCKDTISTKAAAANGNIDILKFLNEEETFDKNSNFTDCMKKEQMAALVYLIDELKVPLSASLVNNCIDTNYIDGLKLLLPRMKNIGKVVKLRLAARGSLECFECFIMSRFGLLFADGREQIAAAVRYGKIDNIRMLHEHGAVLDKAAVQVALDYARGDSLKTLIEMKVHFDIEQAMTDVSDCRVRGVSEVMKVLHRNAGAKFRLEHLLNAIHHARIMNGPYYLLLVVQVLTKSGPGSPIDEVAFEKAMQFAKAKPRSLDAKSFIETLQQYKTDPNLGFA